MIRAWFGTECDPFSLENIVLLRQQQDVYDALKVHCNQGGLCLVMGEPGTGKSVVKYANSERRLSSPFRVTDFHSELNREHHYERIRAQKKI